MLTWIANDYNDWTMIVLLLILMLMLMLLMMMMMMMMIMLTFIVVSYPKRIMASATLITLGSCLPHLVEVPKH